MHFYHRLCKIDCAQIAYIVQHRLCIDYIDCGEKLLYTNDCFVDFLKLRNFCAKTWAGTICRFLILNHGAAFILHVLVCKISEMQSEIFTIYRCRCIIQRGYDFTRTFMSNYNGFTNVFLPFTAVVGNYAIVVILQVCVCKLTAVFKQISTTCRCIRLIRRCWVKLTFTAAVSALYQRFIIVILHLFLTVCIFCDKN